MIIAESKDNTNLYFDNILFQAAKEGKLAKIQEVMTGKVWIDMPDEKGRSMLYHAARNGHKEIVQFLLDKGAHPYSTIKGNTVLDKATSGVKTYLENKETKSLDRLIEAKIAEIDSVQEVLSLIAALPKKYQQQTLKDYSMTRAFNCPEKALEIIECTEGENRMIAVHTIILTALSCNDTTLATECVEKLPMSDPFKKDFEWQITGFITQRDNFWKELMEDSSFNFGKAIGEGARILNILHELPETSVSQIVEGMSEKGTLEGALNYANSLESCKLKGFARCALSHAFGFESFAKSALEGSDENDESEFEKYDEIMREAAETGDFAQALQKVQEIKDPKMTHMMTVGIALMMCQAGKYEESYKVLKQEIEKTGITIAIDERSVDIFETLEEMLEEKNEKKWLAEFKELLKK